MLLNSCHQNLRTLPLMHSQSPWPANKCNYMGYASAVSAFPFEVSSHGVCLRLQSHTCTSNPGHQKNSLPPLDVHTITNTGIVVKNANVMAKALSIHRTDIVDIFVNIINRFSDCIC
ncbi:hypothetical protein T11_2057 [Trichinella zimbabwensis]|uniref:Uncharacterized protein n=1 Tax=Trichinella zimbabwensis TaxID=268475 RepID=A0A0V1HVD8_9BILA|nr:hypothetical protein T11_2057 [Trichinella zimbabwensis]